MLDPLLLQLSLSLLPFFSLQSFTFLIVLSLSSRIAQHESFLLLYSFSISRHEILPCSKVSCFFCIQQHPLLPLCRPYQLITIFYHSWTPKRRKAKDCPAACMCCPWSQYTFSSKGPLYCMNGCVNWAAAIQPDRHRTTPALPECICFCCCTTSARSSGSNIMMLLAKHCGRDSPLFSTELSLLGKIVGYRPSAFRRC